MQRREEEIDVLECALLIAKHAHPDLVIARPQHIRCISVGGGKDATHACILRTLRGTCKLAPVHCRTEVHAAGTLRTWRAVCVRPCRMTQCRCASFRWTMVEHGGAVIHLLKLCTVYMHACR
jgi:hypothetical protein